jgi:hypothetical protein
MRTNPPSRRRRAVALLAAVVAIAAVTTAGPAGSADAPEPGPDAPAARLTLKGGGSWGPYREVLRWQDDLSEADQPIDLTYTPHGSLLGRQDFLDDKIDYVLSGVGFTPAELAEVPGGANGLIVAPVQVSSLGFLLQSPIPDGLTEFVIHCDPDDPNTPDPDSCLERRAYTGPVRIPNDNLAAMALRFPGPSQPPLTSWNNPAVLSAMGVDNFTTSPLAGPAPVLRSDADEASYYLQQWVATAAPSVWSQLKAAESQVQWEPITERLPRQAGASRDGVEQQGQQLTFGGGDPASGTITGFTAGVFAPLPASALSAVKQGAPNADLEFIQIRNANGDWVAPTPDSINAAVNAGGGAPNYALTNKVPGAYPLVWVDNLYAPAKGLSVQRTEATATLIRYLATDGQEVARPAGEGRLSPALVAMALAAANQLVKSNCEGPDRHVEDNTDPGPFAPDLPGIKAIGTMSHCVQGAAAPAGAGSGSGSGSGGSSSFTSSSDSSGAAASDDPGATGESGELKEKSGASAALSASKLPLPLPPIAGGLDRFATLLIGAAAYFVFRKPIRRALRQGAP